jgi:amino acid transporter
MLTVSGLSLIPFSGSITIDGASGRFLAFWTTLVQAAFSYLGTEIVCLTAGEAENPRRNVPKAIRRVFYRILVFYVVGVFVIGITVDPNNPNLLSSLNFFHPRSQSFSNPATIISQRIWCQSCCLSLGDCHRNGRNCGIAVNHQCCRSSFRLREIATSYSTAIIY